MKIFSIRRTCDMSGYSGSRSGLGLRLHMQSLYDASSIFDLRSDSSAHTIPDTWPPGPSHEYKSRCSSRASRCTGSKMQLMFTTSSRSDVHSGRAKLAVCVPGLQDDAGHGSIVCSREQETQNRRFCDSDFQRNPVPNIQTTSLCVPSSP